jgi:lysine 6-dehydrogenase
MADIIILGAGMVGRAMAADLAQTHAVTCVDINADALNLAVSRANIKTQLQDVTDKNALRELVTDTDLVVNATPGHLGFAVLQTLIETGRNIVDISFFPEDALSLDAAAKQQGVTAIVDMGVAPGMGNVLLGHHDQNMQVQHFECLVGGLPKRRQWPFQYKAPFSPVDVIEEYLRPARLMVNGKVVTRPALSDCEYVDFAEVGTLEAFNTDGLRSLLTTMAHIPDMAEKTLRYPGHVSLIQALKQSGFFSHKTIDIDHVKVSPLAFTSAILKNEWTLEQGEEEFTVMRVTIAGEEAGHAKTYRYHLYDEYDPASDTSSMARTTGYACTAAVNMVLDGLFSESGMFAPEQVGRHENCFEYIMQYLAQRQIQYRQEIS